MLETLNNMFVGKAVCITHTNRWISSERGVCKIIHATPGTSDSFDLEMEDGSRYGFVPEVVTETSVEGELQALAGGRRKIEII